MSWPSSILWLDGTVSNSACNKFPWEFPSLLQFQWTFLVQTRSFEARVRKRADLYERSGQKMAGNPTLIFGF